MRSLALKLEGFFAVSQAWAAEPDTETQPREVHTPLGDFHLVRPQKSASEEQAGTVGILVAMKDGILTIQGIAENGPAAKADLKKGEIILSIDGVSTKGMKLEAAAQALRGKPGTLVVLRVKRGKMPWGRKVPLIRSAASYSGKLEPGATPVRFESVPLDQTGKETCPPVHNGCYFLFLSDDKKNCSYVCSAN